MKRTVKRAVARLAPSRAPADGIRVLLYHAVDRADSPDRLALRVSPENFLSQMRYLREHGWSVVPLEAVLEDTGMATTPRVALTFDDGYRDLQWAFDELRALAFPATVFVVPRFLDGTRTGAGYWERWEHFGWDELPTVVGDGINVGAHSMNHVNLRECDERQLDAEVSGSRSTLEQRLGMCVSTFSYPYGRHDRRVRAAVKRAGYRIGCTSRYGLNRASHDSYAIRRTEISGTDSLTDFERKLSGRYDWLSPWQAFRQ